ncbi:MAG: hypothetical protein H6940_09660 [Burkholderiales bacterium]|nr:hypothetical protein [Burkholderiales bacterium]
MATIYGSIFNDNNTFNNGAYRPVLYGMSISIENCPVISVENCPPCLIG